MNMNENEKRIIEKTSHYASRETEVHLSLLGGKFYNGIIVDVNDIRLLIFDRKLGETYVPISEVIDVEPFTENKDVRDKEVDEK